MTQGAQIGALWQSRAVGGVGSGKEIQEWGYIPIPMTDSCWYVAETNTILYSNYSPIKNTFK